MKKKRTVLTAILTIACALILAHLVVTSAVQIILRHYINSFEPVSVSDRIVPAVEEEGFQTFRTDGEFNIMQISDIHLGCGIASIKKDKKSIYEVMTMVQKEKPDLIVLNGDSVFSVPAIIFNGGGTFNNRMASKVVIHMMNRLGIYWTVSFGNHDTEAFDFTGRKKLGNLYMNSSGEYCIFNCDYDGYGVTNQCILLKKTDGTLTKAIFVIDSNDYVDNSLKSSINWMYDTIHDEQVQWVKETVESLSAPGEAVKSICFFHIPIGEFATAYRDLEANNFADTLTTEYLGGFWDELVDEEMGERIWYGGCCQTDVDPEDVDSLFEVLGPDGINTLEGVFCGHDHLNTAVVKYKGVVLGYGNSIDNLAYEDIAGYGIQRGAMVISIDSDGEWTQVHKNAYLDYGVEADRFFDVDCSSFYYDGVSPAGV